MAGLAQLRALALPPYTTRRRDDSLELLAWITSRIDQLDERIAAGADTDPPARLLLTHPGVGPLTALTTVLSPRPVRRFPHSKHVVSSVGVDATLSTSTEKQ